MVRPAVESDRWRIAEILVFAKCMAYRPIFQDDFYSFHLLNVHDTAQEVDPSAALVWEEDGILKGVLTFGPARDQDCLNCCEVYELYIDPCFQREGIGSRLMGEVLGKGPESAGGALVSGAQQGCPGFLSQPELLSGWRPQAGGGYPGMGDPSVPPCTGTI